ncbi:MAG: phosphoribosyltransferase family protein [Saprospiraceae bacterium]
MKILDTNQISQKIKRMAIEIYERHSEESQIFLAGVNNNGLQLANLLLKEIESLSPLKASICQIKLNPAKPTESDIIIDLPSAKLKSKVVILVDDVANTGRTIFFACKPFMNIIVKKIEVAVLIDRTHKSFPIQVGYVGLCLATTVKDNIIVNLDDKKNWSVELE